MDDSVVYRKLVSQVADGFEEIEVVGVAPNGEIALHKIARFDVQLVLCDVHMPEKDGVQTLEEIQAGFPKVLVVMMSAISTRNADITVKALEKGAIDFIEKPETGSKEESIEKLQRDIASILRLVRVRVQTGKIRKSGEKKPGRKEEKTDAAPQPAQIITKKAPLPRTFSVLAVGVSTGGPEALKRFVPALPAILPVPVLLVQHMPPHFTRSLAESLDRISPLRVVEAEENMELTNATMYIAPGGRHMTVKKDGDGNPRIGINDSPPENSCRPSVDVLFRSIAATYGESGILSVVLTGMGNDGLSGVRTMKRKGCMCITQSADSCVVYGMPRAVDEEQLSDKSLPLEEIAPEICRRLGV